MRILHAAAVGLAAFLGTAGVAEAVCQQRDLAGRWQLSGIAAFGTLSGGVRCSLSVNQAGIAIGSCTAQILGIREVFPIFDGILRVTPNCAVGSGRERLQLSGNGQVMNGLLSDDEGVINLTGIKVARRPGLRSFATAGSEANGVEPGGCEAWPDDPSPEAAIRRSICRLVTP